MRIVIAALFAMAFCGLSEAQDQAAPPNATMPKECSVEALKPWLSAAMKARADYDAVEKLPAAQPARRASAAADLAVAEADLAAALGECESSTGASDDEAKVFVGELRAVSRENLELRRNKSIISIGFVGDPAALAELDGVKVGEQVRAVFGSTPRPGGNGRINKLLSIRRCAKNDAQCTADGMAHDEKDAEEAKARAISNAERSQCNREMKRTLLGDTRFAPPTTEMTDAQSKALLRQFNALTGQRKVCAASVLKDHQSAVLEACELHHCGDGIGGGCSHIAGYSLSKDVFARALVVCNAE